MFIFYFTVFTVSAAANEFFTFAIPLGDGLASFSITVDERERGRDLVKRWKCVERCMCHGGGGGRSVAVSRG